MTKIRTKTPYDKYTLIKTKESKKSKSTSKVKKSKQSSKNEKWVTVNGKHMLVKQ